MLARMVLFLLMATVAYMPLYAQVFPQWIQYYNGWVNGPDRLNDLAVDDSGNVLVTGISNNNYLTIKYDNSGNQIWSAISIAGEANALALDGEGNVYVTGDGYCTYKYDTFGNLVWQAYYSGASADAYALALDNSGNVYVTGFCAGGYYDYYTAKYDNNGNQLWGAQYNDSTGGDSDDRANAIAVDGSGNVCVTGKSGGLYDPDITTVKYDANGNQLWVARYDGPGNNDDNTGKSIAVDESGNIYVTGVSDWHFATIKYNPAGTQLWVAISSSFDDYVGANALALDAGGNVYVTGNSGYTFKYNALGNQLWGASYGGMASEAYSIALDDSGNAYVAGRQGDYMYSGNGIAVKYSPYGNQLWEAIHDGPASSYDEANSLAVDDSGNVYIGGYGAVGTYYSWPYWYDDAAYTTIKFSQTSPPPLDIALAPINPPIIIPLSGGSFDFNVFLTNSASSSQNFDAWISVQLPSGSWYGPVLGPVNLTLPAGGNLERLRTQNVPGSAPAGTYTYRGYVGDYPAARWDSSSFTFEKTGVRGWGLGVRDWENTGEDFTPMSGSGATPTMKPLITSVSPNPFNAVTVASFELRVPSYVNLQVYDIAGRLVETLVDGWREAGHYNVPFDGSHLPSGIYLYRIEAGQYSASGKMLLLK